jgi:hypothetical protein
MAAVLAGLGGRAITTAAAHEDAVTSGLYAALAAREVVPGLLSGDPGPGLGEAVITAETPSWDAIGLGAITDFVQQAFGPVDLDRSLVELTVTAAPRPGCPGWCCRCRGAVRRRRRRLWYGRGGVPGGQCGRRRAWLPGYADELHRPGRAGARAGGPA